MLTDLLFRLRALFRRGRVEDELHEELQFHFDEQVAAFERQGFAPDDARRRARLRFGGLDQVKEECRDARGVAAVSAIARDVRYALRIFRRNPGFTAVAALSFAVGIGANAAIFAVSDAFLFRPIPVKDADRLVALADRSDTYGGYPISYPDFADWKARNRVFDEMGAYRNGSRVLADGEGAERVRELQVTDGFLRVIGAQPIAGRDILPSEHVEGAVAVALIGYDLWQRRFNGRRAALGKAITLDGRPFTVVGVLPPAFNVGVRADVLTSLAQWRGTRERRGSHNSLYGIARLKPGVTRGQARSAMDTIAAGLEREYPETNRGRRVDILPFGHVRMRETSRPLFLLMGVVGVVLLIACANIASLLWSRSAGRAREIAVRRAIGAGRARLVHQLLTETLLLALFGGALGLALGEWGCRALVILAGDPSRWPGGEAVTGIHVDGRVFLFTLAVTVCAGLVSGLAPALQASKGSLASPLRAVATGPTVFGSRWFGGSLVAVEVALALVLLTGAGLLIRTLHVVLTGETGFDASHVLTFSLTTGDPRAAARLAEVVDPRAALEASTRRIVEQVQALPGVKAAAVVFPLPFGRGFSADCFHVEGRPVPAAKGCPDALVRQASPGYAAALGMRLVRGRWFAESDDESGAAVNETMARAWWPGRDAVGRRFRIGTAPAFSPWYTVLGVVADARDNGLASDLAPEIYVRRYGGRDLLVRTAGEPLALVNTIRATIRASDPACAMFDAQPLESLISESVRNRRALTVLLGLFATIALVLASVGIYGVVSFGVAQRRHEMGVRMALGAPRNQVLRIVLARGMAPVAAGTAIGGVASLLAARTLTGFLYGVAPTDPAVLVGVTALLGVVAFSACLIPARRATRVDPIVVLRCE